MPERTCSIDGCDGKHYCRGWCAPHYNRWRRHGDPLWTRPPWTVRFWAKVDVRGPDECWLWTAGKSCGYGSFGRIDGSQQAHVIAYELLIGPIPDGLELDHLCHGRDEMCHGGGDCPHRLCVNPAHLEPVTRAVNIARGRAGIVNATKTHCKHGHPLSGENLQIREDTGQRCCRTCLRNQKRAYKQRRREAVQV